MSKDSFAVLKDGIAGSSRVFRAGLKWGPTLGLVVRELIGWGLLILGLSVFRVSFSYLDQRQVVEAGVATMIGLFIFRGGMQLLKVAVASRTLMAYGRQDS